jgi:methylthioribulose-1-phosphate dehydratase
MTFKVSKISDLSIDSLDEYRESICEFARLFYLKGWVSGTGGGVCVRVDEDRILIAPSGVQKERLQPEDLFVVSLKKSLEEGEAVILEAPPHHKISACTSIFLNIFKERPDAKAVIHSHSINAVMATKITEGSSVTLEKYEMLKGIQGCTYSEPHQVTILNNVEHECDLADDVAQAVRDNKLAHCVLVRDHGVYVWGNELDRAKIHAECYDYLFEAKVKEASLRALGLIK